MIRGITLDEVLRLLFGSVMLVTLEGGLRGHFLLDGSPDPPRFRVPFNVIANFEVSRHWSCLSKESAYGLMISEYAGESLAGNDSSPASCAASNFGAFAEFCGKSSVRSNEESSIPFTKCGWPAVK